MFVGYFVSVFVYLYSFVCMCECMRFVCACVRVVGLNVFLDCMLCCKVECLKNMNEFRESLGTAGDLSWSAADNAKHTGVWKK